MATLAAQITPTGISAPDYADIFAQLQAMYWQIYGTDADLDPDSQDGQMIAIFAQAVYDSNMLAVATYQAYSPATAQGVGLSSVVKINGIQRDVPTNSTATVTVTGVAGATITGGLVGDDQNLGTQWALPATVTIPPGGTIAVTATSTAAGAVAAGVGTLTQILTPTLGWQGVTNAVAAAPGSPVETDAALRSRQSGSTAVAAQGISEAIYAAIANLSGVTGVSYDDNDTDAVDPDGVPAHSLAFVVTGGSAAAIAGVIAVLKPPGTPTYGTTTVPVADQYGIVDDINFFQTTAVTLTVQLTIQSLSGYTAAVGTAVVNSVVNFVNSLEIGQSCFLQDLIGAASPQQVGAGTSYYVTIGGAKQSRPSDAPPAVQDVIVAFNEQVICVAADVTLAVL